VTAEPRWVPRRAVEAIHLGQLREHGGLPGIRDENALESALARARQKHHYDLALLGAAFGFALARSHAFNDGNKRIAFLAMVTFLGINGQELDTSEADVVTVMIEVASGQRSEEQLAEWIRSRLVPYRG
jgi:death-on-curing protein